MAGWMIDEKDPARQEVVRRAMELGITGDPEKAANNLGEVTLANGRKVTAHVIHAADPIITDGEVIVTVNRRNPPGMGNPVLPGGLLDPKEGGGVEVAVQTAAREAMEEANIELPKGTLIGTRNMNRPFDVRVATKDLPQYGVAEGDIFMVSTQAVRFDVPGLKNIKLEAGDDAAPGSARLVKISDLTRESMGIPDHYDMIVLALPEKFSGRAALEAPGDRGFTESFKNADVGTGRDQAVFWSNDFRPDETGKPTARNKQLAEDLTQDGIHQVIKNKVPVVDEMWSKDFKFDGQEVSPAAKTKVSSELSRLFAEQASGTVTVFANYTGATSFFRANELPALMANDNVKDVTFLDTQDNKITLPKDDWHNWQREQWVEGRIEKLNDTNKAWTEQIAKWNASHQEGEKAPEPNKFAVGDFANEVATVYRNIATENKPAYIDAAKEQAYADKLQKALQCVDNQDLRNRVIEKINETLKNDDVKVKDLFAKDMTPVSVASTAEVIETYTVKNKDTLLGIAKERFGSDNMITGFLAIKAVNPQIGNSNKIKVGETLTMPTDSQLAESREAIKQAVKPDSAAGSRVLYSEVLPKITRNNYIGL